LSHVLASGHYTGITGRFTPGDLPVAALSSILRHVRRIAADADRATTDTGLLARYAESRDESAFEQLLSRHGPLVWGVCTRLLRDRHIAEDAFQATFLVLARRPTAVRRPEALGCWLHGVARRVAGKLRRPPRVAVNDQTPIADGSATPFDRVTGRELLGLLDEELGNLPERLRAPLVLCYLEGRTRDEAARALGWSLGTLKRRLEQGKAGLRFRLERRGVSLPAALLTVALAEQSAEGAVPGLLIETVLRATGSKVAAVTSAISATATTVADEIIATIAVSKIKAAAVALFFFAIVAGIGWAAYPKPQSSPPQVTPPLVAGNRPADALPGGAIARLGSPLRRIGNSDFALTPDGKEIIAVSPEGIVRRFDANDGRLLEGRQFTDRQDVDPAGQSRARLSADGRVVAIEESTAGARLGRRVTVWDVALGKMIFRRTPADGDGIGHFALSPDGRWLAVTAMPSGREPNILRVFDLANGRATDLGDIEFNIYHVLFSADGRRVVATQISSETREKWVACFDVATAKQLWRRPWPGGATALSPDGNTVIAAGGTAHLGQGAFSFTKRLERLTRRRSDLYRTRAPIRTLFLRSLPITERSSSATSGRFLFGTSTAEPRFGDLSARSSDTPGGDAISARFPLTPGRS
jgi:RNA polymerase sigma factor (sigma-70 family)